MKQKIACFLFVLIGMNTLYAQSTFEKGYILTNEGQKITCLIKNKNWSGTPKSFTYKTQMDGSSTSINAEDIKEIKISERLYVRKNVSVDLSSDELADLSKDKEAHLVSKSLLLEKIISGGIQVYVYKKNSFIRFFFQKKGQEITQLIYKRYIDPEDEGKIKENKLFHRQLWENFNCEGSKIKPILRLKYTRKDILLHFKRYTSCKKIAYTFYDYKPYSISFKKDFTVSPILGVAYVDAFKGSSLVDKVLDTDYNNLSIYYGAELEFFIPTFKRNISILSSILIHNFDKTNDFVNTTNQSFLDGKANMNYSSFEVALLARFYFPIKGTSSKLFLTTGLTSEKIKASFTHNSASFDLQYVNIDFDDSFLNFKFGAGYKYKDYFIQLLYSKRNKNKIPGDDSDYLNPYDFKRGIISLTLGYNLF